LKSLSVGGRQVAIASIGNGCVEFDLVDFYHNLQRLIGVDTIKLSVARSGRGRQGLGAGARLAGSGALPGWRDA
jgi:hypothetical protein